ncbi:MAG: 50S ribosomal protein L22 [Chloroflexi bacterium]|nr:50S ribosomal protein L22 [Chloroflexota bacterium]
MAEGFLIRATARYVPMSAQKVRLIVNAVRGLAADEALAVLRAMPQAAAGPVAQVVRSAVANGEENFGVSRDDLVVHSIYADEGPTRKWRRFGARGRFKPLLRRSSHITVVLTEAEGAS